MALWGVALALLNFGPVVGFHVPGLGRSETRTWDIEGHHFSERCGLFIIIALGESILVTGAAFGETSWTWADGRRLRQRLPRHARHVVALFRRRRRARRAPARPGQGSGTDGAARLHLFPHPDRRRDHRHRGLGRDGGRPSRRPCRARRHRLPARRAGALSVRQPDLQADQQRAISRSRTWSGSACSPRSCPSPAGSRRSLCRWPRPRPWCWSRAGNGSRSGTRGGRCATDRPERRPRLGH